MEQIPCGQPLSYSNGGMKNWFKVESGTKSFKAIIDKHSKMKYVDEDMIEQNLNKLAEDLLSSRLL